MPTCGETGFGYKKTKCNRISVFRSANRFPVYRLQHYPQGMSAKYSAQFQKNFLSPKMAAILNFRVFDKNSKTRKLLVSPKPCEIWVKFLACRVYMQDTLLNSPKIFPLSKNGGHFEFLTKMVKFKIACIS